MKFGKRLTSEASVRGKDQGQHFVDYKACKKAVQQDVALAGLLQALAGWPLLLNLLELPADARLVMQTARGAVSLQSCSRSSRRSARSTCSRSRSLR